MALYEPLRDSFREFNKMLIDSQQWDTVHAQREEDRKFKNIVLQNNIEQQAFTNEMTKATQQLRVRGLNLEADKFDQQVINQDRDYLLNTDRLAETNRHNTSMEGYSATNAKANLMRAGDAALTAAATRKKMAEELKLTLYQTEEVPITFEGIADETDWDNPAFRERVNQIGAQQGWQVGEDGIPVTEDGTPAVMMRESQGALQVLVGGVAEQFEDTTGKAQGLLVELADQDKLLAEQQNEVTSDQGMGIIQKASIQRERNKIKGAAKRVAAILTPQGQLKTMEIKADRLRQRARVLDGYSGTKDAADGLRADADDLDKRIKEALTAKTKNRTTQASQTKTIEAAFQFGHDQLRKDYTPSKTLLPVFPDQTAAVIYVEGLFDQIASMVDEDGNLMEPTSKREAAALKRKVQELHKKNHNMMYNEYTLAKDNAEDLIDWQEASQAQLGYEAKKPYAQQIFRLPGNMK